MRYQLTSAFHLRANITHPATHGRIERDIENFDKDLVGTKIVRERNLLHPERRLGIDVGHGPVGQDDLCVLESDHYLRIGGDRFLAQVVRNEFKEAAVDEGSEWSGESQQKIKERACLL